MVREAWERALKQMSTGLEEIPAQVLSTLWFHVL